MLRPDVRSGSKADITNGPSNVRFTRESRPLSSVVPGLTVTSTDNSRDFSLTRTIVQPPCLLVAKSAVTFSLRGIVWPDRLRRQFRHHRRIALPKRRCRFRELRYVQFRWSSHRNKRRRFSEWRGRFQCSVGEPLGLDSWRGHGVGVSRKLVSCRGVGLFEFWHSDFDIY
jgi:hypothetical protein